MFLFANLRVTKLLAEDRAGGLVVLNWPGSRDIVYSLRFACSVVGKKSKKYSPNGGGAKW